MDKNVNATVNQSTSEKKNSPSPSKRIVFIFKMITSVLMVVLGALFLVMIYRLYFAPGDGSKYTYLNFWRSMLLPLLGCVLSLIFVIVGAILLRNYHPVQFLVSPYEKLKLVSAFSLSEENEKKRKVFDKKIFIARWIATGLFAICLVFIILYMVQPKHFRIATESAILREDARNMMYYLSPFLVGSFVIGFIYSLYENKVINEEIKFILAHKEGKKEKVVIDTKKEMITLRIIQGVVIVTALTFLIVGCVLDGPASILKKAANICTECIGLG